MGTYSSSSGSGGRRFRGTSDLRAVRIRPNSSSYSTIGSLYPFCLCVIICIVNTSTYPLIRRFGYCQWLVYVVAIGFIGLYGFWVELGQRSQNAVESSHASLHPQAASCTDFQTTPLFFPSWACHIFSLFAPGQREQTRGLACRSLPILCLALLLNRRPYSGEPILWASRLLRLQYQHKSSGG